MLKWSYFWLFLDTKNALESEQNILHLLLTRRERESERAEFWREKGVVIVVIVRAKEVIERENNTPFYFKIFVVLGVLFVVSGKK